MDTHVVILAATVPHGAAVRRASEVLPLLFPASFDTATSELAVTQSCLSHLC